MLRRYSGAVAPSPRRRSGGVIRGPVPVLLSPGSVAATKDGSVGQTYALTGATWSSGTATRQWYRETLATPRNRTAIAGATGASYVAQAADAGTRLVCIESNRGVTAIAAAIGVVLAAPLMLDAMDDAGAFTLAGAAAVTNDTGSKVQGASALRIARTPSFNQLTRANVGTFDPATLGTLAYWYRTGEGDPELSQVGSLGTVALGQGGSYAGTISDGSSEGSANQNDYRALSGAWMAMHASESATIAGYSPATPMGVKVGPFQTNAPANGVTHVDSLAARAGGRPTVILGFDDGLANQHAVIAPLLESRGFRGTFYLPTANLGVDGNRMSVAQAIDLYARGHDLQIDGTSNDQPVGSAGFTTIAALTADIAAQKAWFAARSLPEPRHLCYPNGVHRMAGARVQLTGVTFNATDQCTVSSASGIAIGMKVTAYGLPASTTVTGISGTTITLSNPSSQSGTFNVTFVDAAGPFHTGKVQTALAAAGISSARTTGGGSWLTRFGPSGRALVHPAQTTSSQSLAQMQVPIDLAVLRGTTLEFFIHAATASPVGTEVGIGPLTAMLDYLKARSDAGALDVMTKAQWWTRDGAAGVPI